MKVKGSINLNSPIEKALTLSLMLTFLQLTKVYLKICGISIQERDHLSLKSLYSQSDIPIMLGKDVNADFLSRKNFKSMELVSGRALLQEADKA